jgi:hypothetical protein
MWFLGAISAFSIAVVVQAVLRRTKRATSNITVSFLIAACLPGVIFFSWLIARFGCASETWGGSLVFCLLCELYIFLTTLAMASVTANCLVLLARNQNIDKKLESLYDSANMVGIRIDRLKAINLIKEGPSGLISLTVAGERTVRVFSRIRRFFHTNIKMRN